jgi:peptidoglycan-N-acetylglucosamine deacetylase
MRHRITKSFLTAALCMFGIAHANADERGLQSACFAKDALRSIPGERSPVKGDHDFDGGSKNSKPIEGLAPIAIDPALRGAIRRVDLPKGEKLIALTLDMCEQRGEVAGYDGGIFDYLRRENIKATLFAGGKWMRSHQARTQQLMTDPLFELSSHSETHRNLRLLDSAEVQNEITAPQLAFTLVRQKLAATQCAATVPGALDAVPTRLKMFRFPFGACNAASMTAVNDAGYLAIQWDLSTGDPDPHQSAEAIARAMIHDVRPGSIIIAHGNGRGWNTAAALPLAIPKLKAMGYQFVTVSELLARGKPVIAATCYDSHPGDTDRYDVLTGLHGKSRSASQSSGGWQEALPWSTSVTTSKQARQSRPPAKQTTGSYVPSLSWPF